MESRRKHKKLQHKRLVYLGGWSGVVEGKKYVDLKRHHADYQTLLKLDRFWKDAERRLTKHVRSKKDRRKLLSSMVRHGPVPRITLGQKRRLAALKAARTRKAKLMAAEKLLTATEVAELVGLPVSTIRRYVNSGFVNPVALLKKRDKKDYRYKVFGPEEIKKFREIARVIKRRRRVRRTP